MSNSNNVSKIVFQECEDCATKPGTPYLCAVCINRRDLTEAVNFLLNHQPCELVAAEGKEDCSCHEPHISDTVHTKERCYLKPFFSAPKPAEKKFDHMAKEEQREVLKAGAKDFGEKFGGVMKDLAESDGETCDWCHEPLTSARISLYLSNFCSTECSICAYPDQPSKELPPRQEKGWLERLTQQWADRIEITKRAYVVFDSVALNAWIIPFIAAEISRAEKQAKEDGKRELANKIQAILAGEGCELRQSKCDCGDAEHDLRQTIVQVLSLLSDPETKETAE